MSAFGRLLDSFVNWIRSLFWKQEMELTLVGLQASGKTTLVQLISEGAFQEDMIPTVGFNMKKVTRGNVTIKLWDIGGQASRLQIVPNLMLILLFCSLDFAACGSGTVAACRQWCLWLTLPTRDSLRLRDRNCTISWPSVILSLLLFFSLLSYVLLSRPPLQGIPLLVLANKNDLPNAAPVERVIEALRLSEIEGREVCCYSISAKNNTNLDITMEWLIKRAKN